MLPRAMKWRTIALLGAAGYGAYRTAQRLGTPEGVVPLQPFTPARLAGRWYELARIDHAWQQGLVATTFDYVPEPGGAVRVLQRGYSQGARRWREAWGSLRPLHGAPLAHGQLSFLWPLRTSHIVFALDEDGQHALVCGPTHNDLWVLSRTPGVKAATRAALLQQAQDAGFDTQRLHWVDQRRNAGAGWR